MSDDPKDNPPSKLTLSRDLKDQVGTGEVNTPPAMKLKRRTESETKPSPARTSEAAAPAPSADTPAEASPTPGTSAPESKPGFDPKNPFGDVIKESEIKKPSSPPPDLPSRPAPRIDDGAGAKLEEAIDSLNSDSEPASGKSSLMPSIVVILILILVVGGAGYGLWKILQSSETTESTSAVAGKAPSEQKSKNPIEKAKDAIAKVPVADVAAITETNPSSGLEEAPDETPAESIAEVAPVAEAAPTGTIESSKQNVSKYLSGIHIGGMRKGERPMVIIEGERFLVGDVVQAETGLKFYGIRDGRLAFRDSHGIVYLKSF